MTISFDIGVASEHKHDEVLCGDVVEIEKNSQGSVIALSDGLGSGVKANILATLTSKISARLLIRGVPLQDVVETVSEALPVCQVRQLAYSTFSLLHIKEEGAAYLAQFDNPRALYISDGQLSFIEGQLRTIGQRNIYESDLQLKEGDLLILCSDGVTHAGIEALLPVGLGEEGLLKLVKQKINLKQSAQLIAEDIIEYCQSFSAGKLGDDTTVVAVKVRSRVRGILMSGPPLERIHDERMVDCFWREDRRRAIAGGATANMVSRLSKKSISVTLEYQDPAIPPVATMPGVDLVTEGILTLTKVVEMLESKRPRIKDKKDGASLLLKWLLDCDEIDFLVGLRINPAHLSPGLPFHMGLRSSVLQKLHDLLIERGKICHIHWY